MSCLPARFPSAHSTLCWFGFLLITVGILPATFADEGPFESLSQQYHEKIQPLIVQYCLDCHSGDSNEGELNLEHFSDFEQVRQQPAAWQKIAAILKTAEMPPAESPQLNTHEKRQLQEWVRHYLKTEASVSAGDPGPVVLRRLNHAQYTYTIRDLTGVLLDPAREFPVDGAAGEGFTNTGNALSMSPSLVTKYFDAAKQVASHAVLLPDDIRFSSSNTRRDWTNEILASIRQLYFRYTGVLGDASSLNGWGVSDPTQLTNHDGRVNLQAYFQVLIQQRANLGKGLSALKHVAQEENLSPTYLEHLAQTLTSNGSTHLLDHIKTRWLTAKPEDAQSIADEIQTWQDKLWKFNPVGHFGQVTMWQEPVTPISQSENFHAKLQPTPDANEMTLYLVAATAGDGTTQDIAIWQRPRIERPGRPPLLLRDLRATSIGLPKKRDDLIARCSKYLQAAGKLNASGEQIDLSQFAANHQLDPLVLKPLLSLLGITRAGPAEIQKHLDSPIAELAGYKFVKGWGVAGSEALSIVSNASDDQVKVPGDLNPHKIAVHPRPKQWVAVGWQSPMTGRVRLTPGVRDAHNQCGNGIHWSFELRSGNQRRVLSSGDIDLGNTATIEPIADLPVNQGDLISLVISARDNNHGCDLTEIDLEIVEQAGDQLHWSLSGDCADNIADSNPHADHYGAEGIWHFYTGSVDQTKPEPTIPPGSLLAQWLEETDSKRATELAAQIETLLSHPPTGDKAKSDQEVYQLLTALDGPLFSRIDSAALAATMTSAELANGEFGLDPEMFGSHRSEVQVSTEDLIVSAPSIVAIKVPSELAAAGELVVTGTLADLHADQASIQLEVTTTPPVTADTLLPGIPILTSTGSAAEERIKDSFAAFRKLFPAAMCYPRIVPVDVVVTLILFHREDDHLARLMLNEQEQIQLNRLWDQLHFVSHDALQLVTAFDQLLEFASQDDDPEKYRPLGAAIYAAADKFRNQLIESEPAHLEAILDLATRAYRRPLTDAEDKGIRNIYTQLRTESLSHDQALRLTLARILTAPAFLYRLEQSSPGPLWSPVSDWELANRLSYFLWSSLPDASLRAAASEERLHQPAMLRAQTKRMLRGEPTRRLAIEFACQWLHIRNFDQLSEKNERLFPQFTTLRNDMYEESIQFFTDLFQNDRSVTSILDADHTFLNETLATHYGIPNVASNAWRRIDHVGKFSRGGILAQATFLATQSGASRTSPILRGNWVSETLLGERLPRPPKNVPVLPDTIPANMTERQLTELHTSNAGCAKCHARVDPYGFALEEYDAIGHHRNQDAAGNPIDTRATLPDGATIQGLEGLRTYLLSTRRDTFLRHFCRKLLGFALGRSVQLSDEPLLDEMIHGLANNQYRVSCAIEAIVLSEQFQNIRGRDHDSKHPQTAANLESQP
ncbi:MAG: DUF1592 domain-containing protein [Pirellulales bacterium]